MAGDGASVHTTGARTLDVMVAVAARNGVMSSALAHAAKRPLRFAAAN
jgi:hypothetical protein